MKVHQVIGYTCHSNKLCIIFCFSSGSLSSSPSASSEENDPSLVVDVREKTESVAWVIQMPPSPNTAHFDIRRKRH